MAEEERSGKDWLMLILPRVLRAALWGFIMGGELLIPLFMPGLGGEFEKLFPISQFSFTSLAIIFVGFEVAIQLLRGTIIQYGLSMARALISIVALALITNGGIMSFAIASSSGIPLPPGLAFVFTVDFRVILGIFLILSLLSIIKNLLQTVDFLSQQTEEPLIPPELP